MPKLVEVNVSVSIGGGVAIRDFGGLKSDFYLSESEKWDVSDMSEEEAEMFKTTRRLTLISRLEDQAQKEYEWRLEWRENESGGGE